MWQLGDMQLENTYRIDWKWRKNCQNSQKLTKLAQKWQNPHKLTKLTKTDKNWQNSTHKNLQHWQNPHKLPAQQCDKNLSTFDIHVNRTTDEEITQEST